MSGGHFNYACHQISNFADDLEHEIEKNDDKTVDSWGDTVGYGYSEDTMTRIRVIHKLLIAAGKLAREVEWLYSGDHGEESFCKMVDKITDGIDNKDVVETIA